MRRVSTDPLEKPAEVLPRFVGLGAAERARVPIESLEWVVSRLGDYGQLMVRTALTRIQLARVQVARARRSGRGHSILLALTEPRVVPMQVAAGNSGMSGERGGCFRLAFHFTWHCAQVKFGEQPLVALERRGDEGAQPSERRAQLILS